MEEQMQPQQQNIGFMPHPNLENMSVFSKHLDSTQILYKMRMLLMNKQYDDEEDEWKPTIKKVYKNGETYLYELPPLMEEQEINVIIGYLQTYLSSNTYLSKLESEQINNIMWGVNLRLARLFYKLRYKLSADVRDILWSQIEDAIYIGLNRSNNKITLDALSKTQQSIEHIQAAPGKQGNENKEFKILGW